MPDIQLKVTGNGKELVNMTKLDKAVQKALDDTGKKAQADFQKTTATFSTSVVFTIEKEPNYVKVFTENKLYGMLNNGTSAHLISPKPGGVLRFPSAFGRKTNPGMLYSLAGYKSEDFIYTKLPVMNPGFPARNFDKAIAKKYQKQFPKQVQDAIKSAINSK